MDWLPLHSAAYNGDVGTVTRLLSEGHAVDARMPGEFTPLLWACARALVCDMVPTINALAVAGASVEASTSDASCLMLAAQSGSEQAVAALISHGAKVDRAVDNVTPLMVAATHNKRDVVQTLLAAGATPGLKCGNFTAADYARYHGFDALADEIERLVKAGSSR